jgi:hypothetical protein
MSESFVTQKDMENAGDVLEWLARCFGGIKFQQTGETDKVNGYGYDSGRCIFKACISCRNYPLHQLNPVWVSQAHVESLLEDGVPAAVALFVFRDKYNGVYSLDIGRTDMSQFPLKWRGRSEVRPGSDGDHEWMYLVPIDRFVRVIRRG